MPLGITIWYFNKNHKHHDLAMIVQGFLGGISLFFIGYVGWDISEIITIFCYCFSGISFVSGFYYLIKKIRKKPKKIEK